MFVRRLILVPTGLILAITAGFIFLLIGGLAEPAGRKVLEGIGWIFLLAVRADAMRGEPAASYLALAAKIIWGATLAIVVVPVLLTALIGEVARFRSFIWYIAAPGRAHRRDPLARPWREGSGQCRHPRRRDTERRDPGR